MRNCRKKVQQFQHTAARRRLGGSKYRFDFGYCFNTQPPEGGWKVSVMCHPVLRVFQHTAARRRLAFPAPLPQACFLFQHTAARRRLGHCHNVCHRLCSFNTQPPEGGWDAGLMPEDSTVVSTHSRPKAAGTAVSKGAEIMVVSTHSRPKAAGNSRCLTFAWP